MLRRRHKNLALLVMQRRTRARDYCHLHKKKIENEEIKQFKVLHTWLSVEVSLWRCRGSLGTNGLRTQNSGDEWDPKVETEHPTNGPNKESEREERQRI